jgi:hypothetical protein
MVPTCPNLVLDMTFVKRVLLVYPPLIIGNCWHIGHNMSISSSDSTLLHCYTAHHLTACAWFSPSLWSQALGQRMAKAAQGGSMAESWPENRMGVVSSHGSNEGYSAVTWPADIPRVCAVSISVLLCASYFLVSITAAAWKSAKSRLLALPQGKHLFSCHDHNFADPIMVVKISGCPWFLCDSEIRHERPKST